MGNPRDSLSAAIHANQLRLWTEEHEKPFMFPFVDSPQPSELVVIFRDWLAENTGGVSGLRGLEMCCGKGRNVIWLADQGAIMEGFDFSNVAVETATGRASSLGLTANARFNVQDAVSPWRATTARLSNVSHFL